MTDAHDTAATRERVARASTNEELLDQFAMWSREWQDQRIAEFFTPSVREGARKRYEVARAAVLDRMNRADAAIAAMPGVVPPQREVFILQDGEFISAMEPVPHTADGRPCCTLCESPLDIPGRPWTRSCGGDCLACMAEGGDPDAVAEMPESVVGRGEDRITHRTDGPLDSEGQRFLDEVVIHNATVHIEQMSDSSYWIGVTRGADDWHFWIASRESVSLIDMWCNEAPTTPPANSSPATEADEHA